MISVDGPPDQWAGQVARVMVDHGATPEDLLRFFELVLTSPTEGH